MPRIVTLTGLYPSSARPRHGIFVEERLRQLLDRGRASATVIAPVPWFPFTHRQFGTYSTMARTPATDRRHGIDIRYPRYLSIPKVGMSVAPLLLAAALIGPLRRLRREQPDLALIDSHFLYPDGVAACLAGRILGIPVLMTARGSDVNLYRRWLVPRSWLRWAVSQSARVITVSEALRDALLSLGADPAKVITLRNGVDLERFRPLDRPACRARFSLKGFTLLSVGNLLPVKGHELVIEALAQVPEATLLIAGDGPLRGTLERLAQRLGVADRVRFLGTLDREDLVAAYNAADVLVLASSREGMPNVVLESLACGTPVIATAVGGTPELLDDDVAGRLLDDRSAAAIAAAVRDLQFQPPDRGRVRDYGLKYSWEPTINGLAAVMQQVATRT